MLLYVEIRFYIYVNYKRTYVYTKRASMEEVKQAIVKLKNSKASGMTI